MGTPPKEILYQSDAFPGRYHQNVSCFNPPLDVRQRETDFSLVTTSLRGSQGGCTKLQGISGHETQSPATELCSWGSERMTHPWLVEASLYIPISRFCRSLGLGRFPHYHEPCGKNLTWPWLHCHFGRYLGQLASIKKYYLVCNPVTVRKQVLVHKL